MATPVGHDPQSLVDPVQAGTSISTLYTAPSGSNDLGVMIIGLYAVNGHSTGTAKYTLHHVPSGDAAGDDTVVTTQFPLAALTVLPSVFMAGTILDPGDTIQHLSDTASRVSVHLYGMRLYNSSGTADPAVFTPGQFAFVEVSARLGTVYTSPTGAGKRGTRIRAVEVSTILTAPTIQPLSLYHVESGGTAGDEHLISGDQCTPFSSAQTPIAFIPGAVLNPGDFIQAQSDDADQINVKVYGWEMTD